MYIKTQIVLLLFGVQLYYGYSIAKVQIENGTETYEVRELPNKTVEFVNPEREVPTMREITYYRVIEKPYLPKSVNQKIEDVDEQPDFDETLRPFTNSHGYQFIGWGAQEENDLDEDKNTTAPIASNSTNNAINKNSINKDINDEDDITNDDGNENIATDKIEINDDNEEEDDDEDDDNDDNNDNEDKEKHKDNNDSLEYYDEKDDASHQNNDKNKDIEHEDDEAENETEKKNDDISIDEVSNDDKNIDIKLNNTTENSKIENIETDINVNNETNAMTPKDDENSNRDKIEKTEVKNKTDDIAKKLRNQLFNSNKEKYSSIKRQQENETTSTQTRRKREANYKDIPEPPMLPDLDVTAFPVYLRRMLQNQPRIHITYNDKTHNIIPTNVQSRLEDDAENDDYDLPEPKIEIRNNFSDDEELTENKEISRMKRNVKENLRSNSDDEISVASSHIFHDKLTEMFEEIEKGFTKDGKKPRTYGMNLRGDTARLWNDMTGTSIEVNESENNSRALDVESDSKSNEINYEDEDTEETVSAEHLMVDHQEEKYLKEPVSTEYSKSLEDTLLTTRKPGVPDIESRTELNTLKVNHNMEQIPDKKDMIISEFLPDFKIEHSEQIPRVYRKEEEKSPIMPHHQAEEIAHSTNKATITDNKIDKTTQIPSKIPVKLPPGTNAPHNHTKLDKKDLKLRMEEAFDNVLEKFGSFGPSSKHSINDADRNNSKANDNRNLFKTYGMHLEGDHGYIWNDYNNAGKPIDIGNIENVNITEPNLEVPDSDINKDHLVGNNSEQSIEITTSRLDLTASEDEKTTVQPVTIEQPPKENKINRTTHRESLTKKPDKTVKKDAKEKESEKNENFGETTTEKIKENTKNNIKGASNQSQNNSTVTTKPTDKTDKGDHTEQGEKIDEDVKSPKNTTMESKESMDKDLDTTNTVRNDTEVKLALDDLLKRDEFWQWLSDWSTTYLEVLNERNKILVKNEIARQLEVQNNKNNLSDDANAKPNVQQNKVQATNDKDNTINGINETDTSSTNENAKNNKTNALGNENMNYEKDNNHLNSSKKRMCKNKKSNNSPFTINDKTIYGNAVASGNASNIFIVYPDEQDSNTEQPLQNNEQIHNQTLSEPSKNLIIDETTGCDDYTGSEEVDKESIVSSQQDDTIATPKNYAHKNNTHNSSSLTINAEKIYGSAVATDHVTNIFIFYPNKEYNQAIRQKGPLLDEITSENYIPANLPANVTFNERFGTDENKFESKETETEKYDFIKPESTNETNHKVSDENKNSSNNLTISSEPFNGTTAESNISRKSNEKQDKATNTNEDSKTKNTSDVTVSKDAITTTAISKQDPSDAANNESSNTGSTIEVTTKTDNKSTSAEKGVSGSIPDNLVTTQLSGQSTADNKTTTIDKIIADTDNEVTSEISLIGEKETTKLNDDLPILTAKDVTDSDKALTTTENSDKDATSAEDLTALFDKDATTIDDKTGLINNETTEDKIIVSGKEATTADEKTTLIDKDVQTADDEITLTDKDATKTDEISALLPEDAITSDDSIPLTNEDATIPSDAETTSESPENDSAKSELSSDENTVKTNEQAKNDEDPKDETETTTSDITEAPAKK